MSAVKYVDESNFETEVLSAEEVVLVDFFAEWCGPCKMLSPILDRLATELVGRVNIVKIDVDRSPALAQALRVEAMPTLAVFQAGKEVARMVGAPSEDSLRDSLLSLLESPKVSAEA